ncbi:transposase [Lactobacillus helsingborgensis]|nr:transposase [Lactobacillus helsingborgensis]
MSSSSRGKRLTCHRSLTAAPKRLFPIPFPAVLILTDYGYVKKAWHKYPALNGLIFHTNQGWQYQNGQFQAWLKSHGIGQSMTRKSNSLNDGLMEGSFGMLKREMFYGF